jgi:cytochrome c5
MVHLIIKPLQGRFVAIMALLAFIMGLSACYYDKEEELYPPITQCDTSNVGYQATIVPLMKANCNACHNSSAPSAGIATDNYQGVKTIALNGKLYGSIAHLSGYSPMPKGGNKLSECDIKRVKIWIDMGAPEN